MSVADILKKHGRWLETKQLATMVAKELDVSNRQAYRKINQAWKQKQIRKLTLPDRSILNGLPGWAFSTTPSRQPRETSSRQEAYLYRCLKKIEEISDANLRDSVHAFLELRSFIMTLPPSLKEKVKEDYVSAEKRFLGRKGISLPITWRSMLIHNDPSGSEVGAPEVEHLIDKVSAALHEKLSRKES